MKQKETTSIQVYTDGASRGNPGLAASAFIFVKTGTISYKSCKVLGTKTNNEAEYHAVILALKKAIQIGIKNIVLYSDSSLVINQLNGQFKVNKKHLKLLKEKVLSLSEKFIRVRFIHVPRTNGWISKADELCNRCLDSVQS